MATESELFNILTDFFTARGDDELTALDNARNVTKIMMTNSNVNMLSPDELKQAASIVNNTTGSPEFAAEMLSKLKDRQVH